MRMRIYQSIAKQRLFRNPTDLRQFFVIVHGLICFTRQNYYLFSGHKKYYEPTLTFREESFRNMIMNPVNFLEMFFHFCRYI